MTGSVIAFVTDAFTDAVADVVTVTDRATGRVTNCVAVRTESTEPTDSTESVATRRSSSTGAERFGKWSDGGVPVTSTPCETAGTRTGDSAAWA
ncbi:hypothetical protein OG883_02755 [Streptomyces sp. NBC_01142]|uniref:hypothetical protein n=1 Tax=Streptomyces sp. NBC_01142 TaxID=2975865 RepID=UPI0022518A8C|nr:hypothetical protein [Streptomyces sp. NBC_01142]MCX4818838.1 hypothetical protein [Streptomyces sp. NBC_01142]